MAVVLEHRLGMVEELDDQRCMVEELAHVQQQFGHGQLGQHMATIEEVKSRLDISIRLGFSTKGIKV